MLKKLVIFTLLLGVCAHAADKKPVPVPSNPAAKTFNGLRGVVYCEVWLIVPLSGGDFGANYYNTSGLNNSDPKTTCPADKWAKVDAQALESEYEVATVFKNGPRGWTMDTITLPTGPVQTFGDIQARWMGRADIPKGVNLREAGSSGYKPVKSHRNSSMTFKAGKPVFILEDAEGTPWVMQAWGNVVDPSLNYDNLKDLGSKLKPAPGWKFRVAVPKRDLTIKAAGGFNWIVQDELGNTYDACKDNACNIKP